MAWKDHFAFSKKQRNGILVLLSLILVAIIGLIVSNYLPPSPATVDVSAFKADMAKVKFKQADTAKESGTEAKDTKHARPALTSSVELNTADSAELMKFPLVSPKIARTIVHFRDALGGYYNKKQLLEVYGMDTACYYSMAYYISVDPTRVEKIDINTATEKDMAHHPYIRKKLAKAIYEYRKQNGGFKDIKEVMKVDGMDNDLYLKLSAYLSITK